MMSRWSVFVSKDIGSIFVLDEMPMCGCGKMWFSFVFAYRIVKYLNYNVNKNSEKNKYENTTKSYTQQAARESNE